MISMNCKENSTSGSDEIFQRLRQRIDESYLRERLITQVEHSARIFGRGFNKFHIENFDFLLTCLKQMLKLTGLFEKGFKNFKNIQITANTFFLSALPASFNGYRIMHLSDLHLDIHPDVTEILIDKAKGLEYDLCIITGDFRSKTHGDYEDCLHYLKKLTPVLCCKDGIYAVLGNHDFIEMVPLIEDMGIRVLLNEVKVIKRNDDSIWLLGVDDAHFYAVDNLQECLKNVPGLAFKILLSHTPELYKKASKHPIDILLAGHTHGGQICLPNRKAIITDTNCPRRFISGCWSYKLLQGYTSNGTGSSGVPVRFNCPPEIVIHTLTRGKPGNDA